MTDDQRVKIRLRLGWSLIDYEGSEAFLRGDFPKLLEAVDRMASSQLSGPLAGLINDVHQAAAALDAMKNNLDSMSEVGETESLRLQMAMDRMSKMMSTLSNLLQKVGDTAGEIARNLK